MNPLLIPIVSKLAGDGLDLLANAVLKKGQSFVEEKLNVDLNNTPSEDLRNIEVENEETLIQILQEENAKELRQMEMTLNDRASAREMHVATVTSSETPPLVKLTPVLLDLGLFLLVCGIVVAIFIFKIPEANKELLFTAVGTVIGYFGATVNFHRGTSQGSADKNKILDKLLGGDK
jgi:hypothetical protein